MRRDFLLLSVAAVAEVVSLTLLLTNLVTVHLPAVSSTVGPIHGCAYLLVIVATLIEEGATARAKTLALIPAVGGLLALKQLKGSAVPGAGFDR